jgi:hypothetical protein
MVSSLLHHFARRNGGEAQIGCKYMIQKLIESYYEFGSREEQRLEGQASYFPGRNGELGLFHE